MAVRASTSAEATSRELEITRVFDAPRSLVFNAWVQPGRLVEWWGPKGFTVPSCAMDVRPGGSFRFVMRSPEGSEHRLQGVFREIVRPERIVLTWAWVDDDGKRGHETLLTVTLAEEGGSRTKLTLRQAVFESLTARDAHRSGWDSGLDCLAEYLAKDAS